MLVALTPYVILIPPFYEKSPTRISLPASLNAIVNHINNGDVGQNTAKTRMLPPTTLAGMAATLPYQLELAAITAAIDRMKQCNAETSVQKNSPMHPTSNTHLALAALSAEIKMMEKNRLTIPHQLAKLCLTKTTPTPTSAMAHMLPDNNNANHPHNP